MATRPGHPGRVNEDFVGAVPDAVVLLDGAGIPGSEHLCHHGTAWYARTLGAALLARLPGVDDLVTVLAEAIAEVAGRHDGTCDLADPSSPQAAVAIARRAADRLDHLVLGDAYVVLQASPPVVVTDPREVSVRAEVLATRDALADQVTAFRALRNRPGGFWVAKESPAAAAEAVTGSVPLRTLAGVALLSNGVGVDDDDATAAYWLFDYDG
jgi:hypothetical protein